MSISIPGGYQVASPLYDFVNREALPGSGVEQDAFWQAMGQVLDKHAPVNARLLARRDELQGQIDQWHREQPGQPDPAAYRSMLEQIGYLVPAVPAYQVKVSRVDPEIAQVAGPQLVVPVNNARYALNAANARWGSLYDALYGTDAIAETDSTQRGTDYNPARGQKVFAWANEFLDQAVPLTRGHWADVASLTIDNAQLNVGLKGGESTTLADAAGCIAYLGKPDAPEAILLVHNGLHIDIRIDRNHPIGQASAAGIKDVILESALTTIQDCEDSVAAVDAEDKVQVYGNWLGLMKGTLSEDVQKGDKTISRTLNPDRHYQGLDGEPLVLAGRSLMLVRNVGSHMLSNVVTDAQGQPVPETILDCLLTSLCAIHDLKKSAEENRNSRTGSVYIVKPKMHGPEEVAAAVALFADVEQALGLERNTLKIGIMDEERRTSVNLAACIAEARERVIFINTGFLDRTGDEIHTSMHAGLMIPKGEMKGSRWLLSYEDNNVDAGLAGGLPGNGQIGKGMWAMPDAMADMLATKQGHPQAGANTAWVPSPTAATLHATHYHQVDVHARQRELAGRNNPALSGMLELPLADPGRNFSAEEVQRELDNNAQGILGYVVRWVNQGVGCSKVPDINNVGLMEDRATLRISSQLLANWLVHGLINEQQVDETLQRMAKVVDEQNAEDPSYTPMAPDFQGSIAYQAARDLVLKGAEQANGYTEFLLTERRQVQKTTA